MNTPTEPPLPKKRKKYAIIVIIVTVSVLAFGIYFLINKPPNISGVQILRNETGWYFVENGFGFVDGNPTSAYDIYAYVEVTIANPTDYKVMIRVKGEAMVQLSYELFGESHSSSDRLSKTEDIILNPHSEDIYKITLLSTWAYCDAPNTINVSFSELEVKELLREVVH